MLPAFRPGEKVLSYNWGTIQKGSVVVFRYEGEYLIKRVKELKNDSLVVWSDNKKLAKREYEIKKKDIVGRVFLKY